MTHNDDPNEEDLTLFLCQRCGEMKVWEDCDQCDDGYVEVYDEDPLWYDPGDIERCHQCNGAGGWRVCPNVKQHFAEDNLKAKVKL
jgi:predicted RNA-binding Zn-ribbon protein involved in translation (DUF1610 family)